MITLFLFLSLFIGSNIRYSIFLGLVEAVLLLGFVLYRFSKKTASISLLFIALGVGLSFIRFDFQRERFKSVVFEVKENYYLVSSKLEKLYVYEKDHPYEVGDILEISGYKKELDFEVTESSFDFTSYLNKKGVYYRLYPKSITIRFKTPLRINAVKKKFLSHFNENTSSLVKQLLFGMSDNGESNALLKEMHLIRISNTSGLFLGLILSLITYLARKVVKKDKYADLVGVVFLLIYSLFTYPRFVVIKFVVVGIIKWINEYRLKKKFSYLQLLSGSGIAFILTNHHLAYQDSFLLAYYLPILILFVNGSFRRLRKFKKKLLILLIVNLAMVPFILNFNNELSPLSIVFQIILSPLLILYYFGSWLTFLGIPIYSGMNGFTNFLNSVLNFFNPALFKIYGPPFSSLGVFAYEIFFIVLVYFFSIGFKDIYKYLTLAFSTVLVIYFLPIKNALYTTISFINVGQGDCCVIQSGNTTIMIDTGGSPYRDIATESLIPYLKKNRVYDIDLLITTHDDSDHSGGVTSLQAHFKVKRYIKDYQYFPLTIGGITLTNYNVYPNLWDDDNGKSLVLGFTINDCDFLIMGDAPKAIENQIIKDNPKLECDVLKVGHHGSNTSTSETLVKTLKPKEAIVSCGKNNKYGHPHKETISVLNRYFVRIRRTDIEGTIVYSLRRLLA